MQDRRFGSYLLLIFALQKQRRIWLRTDLDGKPYLMHYHPAFSSLIFCIERLSPPVYSCSHLCLYIKNAPSTFSINYSPLNPITLMLYSSLYCFILKFSCATTPYLDSCKIIVWTVLSCPKCAPSVRPSWRLEPGFFYCSSYLKPNQGSKLGEKADGSEVVVGIGAIIVGWIYLRYLTLWTSSITFAIIDTWTLSSWTCYTPPSPESLANLKHTYL